MKIIVTEKPQNVCALLEAAAKNCYSINPKLPSSVEGNADFLIDLFRSGHYSVFQHANYTLQIEGVSRHLVWDFLHRHPHYTTSQVSQRYTYTSLNETTATIPNLQTNSTSNSKANSTSNSKTNNKTNNKANNKANNKTTDEINNEIKELYNQLGKNYEAIVDLLLKGGVSKKKAQEDARYILPTGTHTHLYYTLNLMSIIRLLRQKNTRCLTCETIQFIDTLYNAIIENDNSLQKVIDYALSIEAPGFFEMKTVENDSEFVYESIKKGKVNDLYFPADPKTIVKELIEELKHRSKTNISLENNLLNYSFMNSILLTSYNFISFAADCQNQRHRAMSQYRINSLMDCFKKDEWDNYIPSTIYFNGPAKKLYHESLGLINQFVGDYIEVSGKSRELELLLPNSFCFLILEKGTLAQYQSKWLHRLCNCAQEEIRNVSKAQFSFLWEKIYSLDIDENDKKEILKHFGPPCYLRHLHDQKPYCLEGKRSCLHSCQHPDKPYLDNKDGIPAWFIP